jgi:hypothetical protein
MLLAEIADLHTQIGALRGNAGIIADIEGRKAAQRERRG